MGNTNSLVSIICPVYNTENYLNETIVSVMNQTYIYWELLLVIDAKSTDGSLAIAKNWSVKDSRIKIIESPINLGVSNNRNHGIQLCSGEWIAFLDSDDLWLPLKLQRQLEFIKANPTHFCCHTYGQIAPDGTPLSVIRQCSPLITYHDLLKSNSIGCLTVMIRADKLKKFSFNTTLPHEDFILWLELLKEIGPAHGLDENLALYRVLPNSRSGNKKRAALDRWMIYRNVLNLNLFSSAYYFSIYAMRAMRQRLCTLK